MFVIHLTFIFIDVQMCYLEQYKERPTMQHERITLGVGAFVLAIGALVTAQVGPSPSRTTNEATTNPRKLGIANMATVPVPVRAVYFEGSAGRCDASGNIYVRPLPPGGALGQDLLPVQKITSAGKLAEMFYLPDNNFLDRGLFVTAGGDVFRMGFDRDAGNAFEVLKFHRNGSVQSKVRLEIERGFFPWHLAIFPGGEFLLSGVVDRTTPKAVLFTPAGKLVKTIYEPEDEEARKQTSGHDPRYLLNPAASPDAGVYEELGDAAVGPDGNVYLLRAAPPALVFVISSKGEVIRKFRVDPGDSNLISSSIWIHHNQLAVAFQPRRGNPALAMVKVVDLKGRALASYALEPPDESDFRTYIGDMACYRQDGITFVHPAQTEVHLRKVTQK